MDRPRARRVRAAESPPLISPDAAFAQTANAAATAFAATPPYVTYGLHLVSRRGDATRDERFTIAFRTSDGHASIVGPTGTRRADVVPALPPAVDALAQWAFSVDDPTTDPIMRVAYVRPKHFTFATPGPDADVVVPSIVGYSVRYADDAHLELTPATADVRASAAEKDHFVYRDVFFDATTSLPRRVVLVAPDETLALDYAVRSGAWLLTHFTYDGARHVAHGSTERFSVEATYDDYAFPATGPA